MTLPNFLRTRTRPVNGLRIVHAAFRRRPKIAQGGPAGVQRLIEEIFGTQFRGVAMDYFYETGQPTSPQIAFTASDMNFAPMVAKNLAAYDILSSAIPTEFGAQFFAQSVAKNLGYYFLCHDIATALAALESGFPYSLIYHQQGASVYELEAGGNVLSDTEKWILNEMELRAFQGAEKVYFPSDGAAQTFFETSAAIDKKSVNLAGNPLYNTIADFQVDAALAHLFLVENGFAKILDPKVRKNYRILISVGDYNQSKGMERSFEFASALQAHCKQKVLWIGIGRRGKADVLAKIEQDAGSGGIETLLIGDRLNHDLVMSLIAYSDQFVMMQRKSIFDFSTLEAMRLGKSVVLSPIGGNLEFNKAENILFHDPEGDPERLTKGLKQIAAVDTQKHGALNADVFEAHFSRECFEKQYQQVLNDIIEKMLGPRADPDPSAQPISNHDLDGKTLVPLEETYADVAGLTPFRALQHYCSTGAFEKGLAFVKSKQSPDWFETPKFLREIAQLHFGADQFAEAAFFYRAFFLKGGESLACQTRLEHCEKQLDD
jgi:glycosyltransferase involved in cell wall biosynthesis